MDLGIAHTPENIGRHDPQYGGTVTDVASLPLGTEFFVRNGCWNGRIVLHNGVKAIQVSEHDTGRIRNVRELAPGETAILAVDVHHGSEPRMSIADALEKNLVRPSGSWQHDDGVEYFFTLPVAVLDGWYPEATSVELLMALGEDLDVSHAALLIRPMTGTGDDEECVDTLDASNFDPDINNDVLTALLALAQKEE